MKFFEHKVVAKIRNDLLSSVDQKFFLKLRAYR